MRFTHLLLGGGQDGTLTAVLLPSLEEESRACPAGSNSCGKCGKKARRGICCKLLPTMLVVSQPWTWPQAQCRTQLTLPAQDLDIDGKDGPVY